uniref:Integrase catalytic domain-containing protein n=1 Tax=Tanacetum cinerariifolium TaxID=118510 RepID=A0A699GP86_TANCI|nr:hypothetical protein [Tanacetum cinerariifolium]
MEAQKAFEKLKSVMTQTPVLQLPDFREIFIIETDASGISIGVVLQQKVADALSRVQGQTKCLQLDVTTLSSELYDKIKKGWSEDSQLKAQIEKLQLNSGSSKHYSWSNGQLLRKGKLVISSDEALRKELIGHFHNGPTGGHSGMQATTKRMGALMYWKKMRNQIKQHIRQCDTCQRYKPELVLYPGLLQPLPIPTSVWAEISMDFIDGLPMTKGRTVIMIIVDRLSKYSHFVPLTHPYTAIQVAQSFLDTIYRLHELPKIIVSDRDAVFMSRFWKELFSLLQVQLHTSTTYHPQTNGQTEVVNKSLECYLRSPLDHITYTKGDNLVDAVDRSLSAREAAIDLLQFHIKRQATLRQGKQHKLSPKYFGPFLIMKKVGKVAYKLQLPGSSQIHLVFHVSQLKLYRGPIPKSSSQLPQISNDGLISEEPFAVLDRRMAKKGNIAVVYVLIQWVNRTVTDATWETYESIAEIFLHFDLNA